MRKKIIDKKLSEKIIDILEMEGRHISIREITKKLKEDYGIKRSPQVVLRHLTYLKKERKIFER